MPIVTEIVAAVNRADRSSGKPSKSSIAKLLMAEFGKKEELVWITKKSCDARLAWLDRNLLKRKRRFHL